MATHLAHRATRKERRTKPRLEALEERSLLAAAVPGVTLDPLLVPKFVNPLPQPLDPSFVFQPTGTTTATLQNGTIATVPLYQVGAFQIQENLGLGLTDASGSPIKTTVYGYGTSADTATYPGRSFVVQSGQPIAVQWTDGITAHTHILPVDPTVLGPNADKFHNQYYTVNGSNQVTFNSGVPINSHLHGGHTTAIFDGTPEQWITAGGQVGTDFVSSPFVYDNSQQAATIWYHDHAVGITRLNVYAGLAGFYIIHDKNEAQHVTSHKLPGDPYDIPIAIQDRMFTTAGQLYYPANVLKDTTAAFPSVHPEFFGDTILVNGQAWPVLNVEPRSYRFRVLNGSQARFYDLSLDSGQAFLQVGTDGGLLDRPVSLTHLLLAPGERADIVVDFSKLTGKTLILKNAATAPFPDGDPKNFDAETTGQIMEFRVNLPLSNIKDVNLGTNKVLNKVDFDKVLGPAVTTRELGLFETTDNFGRLIQKLGLKNPNTGVFTAQDFMDPITEVIKQGNTEIWKIYNSTGDTHPIHLHQVQFQLVSRQKIGMTVDDSGGNFTVNGLIGQPTGPAANEAGWKDTVQMNPGEVTTIRVKFDLPGKYVWHCHILEHEEHDMMRYFLVNSTGTLPTTTANMSLATNSATLTSQPVSTLDQMALSPDVLIGQLPPTGGTLLSTNKRKSLLVQ